MTQQGMDFTMRFESIPDPNVVERILALASSCGAASLRAELNDLPNERKERFPHLITHSDVEYASAQAGTRPSNISKIWLAGKCLERLGVEARGETEVAASLNALNMLVGIRKIEAGEQQFGRVGQKAWDFYAELINGRIGTSSEPIMVLPWENSIHQSLKNAFWSATSTTKLAAIHRLQARYASAGISTNV